MNENLIKEFIIDSEILNQEQLEAIEDLIFKEEVEFTEALLRLGYLDQETLLQIGAAIMGVPKVDLSEKIIPLDVFKIIPEPVSDRYNLIAFEKDNDGVSVAFAEMSALEILDEIIDPKFNLKLYWADLDEILEKKKKYIQLSSEELFFKSQNAGRKILKINDFGIKKEEDLPKEYASDIANDLYTEKFINSLFEHALNSKADFIFFNLSEDLVEISFRIFERNYKIMDLSREVLFSILAKLKF
jgi:type II secretory ATPase GspE/PulE/Tfp pilus assembly ATPase PilB-like protein